MAVIYRHLKPCGEVFYIGIGEKESRAYDIYQRNKWWKNVTSKYGCEVQILKRNLSWKDACELETILISYYGRKDLQTGLLVNLTDGGERVLGRIMTKEHKQKISDAHIGRKKSQEVIQKRTITLINNNLNTKINVTLSGFSLQLIVIQLQKLKRRSNNYFIAFSSNRSNNND